MLKIEISSMLYSNYLGKRLSNKNSLFLRIFPHAKKMSPLGHV